MNIVNPMCHSSQTMPIKRFKDLYIDCNKEEARAFIEQSLKKTEDPALVLWAVEHNAMKRLQDNICFVDGLYSCTTYLGDNDKKEPMATITLVYNDERRNIWISNIVPCQIGELSIDQYNQIFDRFCHDIVQSTVEGLRLNWRTTSESYTAADVMTEGTWNKLNSFSEMANRTSLHPYDLHRWNKFVISAFQNDRDLDSSTLKKILHLELGWPAEKALHLAMQYEDGIELLREYTGR